MKKKYSIDYEQYDETDLMDFSEALSLLKDGLRISRLGWNGKNIYIYLVSRAIFKETGCHDKVKTGNFIAIDTTNVESKNEKNTVKTVVPWIASQTDLLSEDWIIV